MYSSFFISYVRPITSDPLATTLGSSRSLIPCGFQLALQAEQFPIFTGTAQSGTLIRPVFRLSIF